MRREIISAFQRNRPHVKIPTRTRVMAQNVNALENFHLLFGIGGPEYVIPCLTVPIGPVTVQIFFGRLNYM